MNNTPKFIFFEKNYELYYSTRILPKTLPHPSLIGIYEHAAERTDDGTKMVFVF